MSLLIQEDLPFGCLPIFDQLFHNLKFGAKKEENGGVKLVLETASEGCEMRDADWHYNVQLNSTESYRLRIFFN